MLLGACKSFGLERSSVHTTNWYKHHTTELPVATGIPTRACTTRVQGRVHLGVHELVGTRGTRVRTVSWSTYTRVLNRNASCFLHSSCHVCIAQ